MYICLVLGCLLNDFDDSSLLKCLFSLILFPCELEIFFVGFTGLSFHRVDMGMLFGCVGV